MMTTIPGSPVTVIDQQKVVKCGHSCVTLNTGAFAFVVLNSKELPVHEIPNMIAALQTAYEIGIQPRDDS